MTRQARILAWAAIIPWLATGCRQRVEASKILDEMSVRAHDVSEYPCPVGDVPVAFFDADSTLRVSKSGSVSANGPDDVNILPFVGNKLAEVHRQGYLIAIVSNQGGIAQGHITADIAEGGLMTTARLVQAMGGTIDYIAYAPKDDDERKPKPGMGTRLNTLLVEHCGHGIDMTRSFMVGDSGFKRGTDDLHPDGRPADDFSNADRGFAKNFLSPNAELTPAIFQEPTDYFGWKTFGVFNIENQGELEDFIETIEARAVALRIDGDLSQAETLNSEVENLRRVNRLTPRFRYVHYNIKELHTGKLLDDANEQVKTAARNLRNLSPDLVSINEMQYDQADTPLIGYPGTGNNLQRLMARTMLPNLASWTLNLAPANTGKRSKKKPDGSYALDPNAPGASALADIVSFGTFPGQYSTGFGTRFPIDRTLVITDLKWSDWDSAIDLAALKLSNGSSPPADMELFDKNFNDAIVRLDDRPAHVITFHTVPAFGFGGSAAHNIARNKAQLEFLEWYLLGVCDPSAASSAVKRCATDIKPLSANTPFIAVGDFNVDWETPAGGAEVLKRMLIDPRVNTWRAVNPDHLFRIDPTTKKSHVTYMSDGVDLGKLQSELDYFLVSKHFRISSGKVAAPLSWYKEHSCHATKAEANTAKMAIQVIESQVASVSTRYGDNGVKSFCVIEVSREFSAYRNGSDHFPVYLTFGWSDI